jgi:hypothetical protein
MFGLTDTERFLDAIGREFSADSRATDVRLYRMVRKLRSAINTVLDMRTGDPKAAHLLTAAMDYDGLEAPR